MGARLQVGRNVGVGLPNPDSVPQALTRLRSLEYEVVVEARGKPTSKNKGVTVGGGIPRPRKALSRKGGCTLPDVWKGVKDRTKVLSWGQGEPEPLLQLKSRVPAGERESEDRGGVKD